MQVRLKPYHKNLYQVNGLLIKGETVQEWMSAICQLDIDLDRVQAYAVPGLQASTLYGCVLFFNNGPLPKDIRNHQWLQYAGNKFLLPEQSVYLPAVDDEELASLEPGKKILLHPVVGSVILEEPVEWTTILDFAPAATVLSEKPVTGAYIPGAVRAYMLELSDEKLINELLNRPTEKEMHENLPFNMKKLLAGNKREMQKYLRYLETHPDKALSLALPLDTLGSFRGDNKGRFSFSGNWFRNLFGNRSDHSGTGRNIDTGSGTKNYWWFGLLAVILFRQFTCNDTPGDSGFHAPALQMNVTNHESVLDSHYRSIMASKNLALFAKINEKQHDPGKVSDYYKTEYKKIMEQGVKIKDSLTTMYTAIVKYKTDSAANAWKKEAGDSIRKAKGNTSLKEKLAEATAAKKADLYCHYGLYYGIIRDSLKNFPVVRKKEAAETKQVTMETQKERSKASTGAMLLLAGILIAFSFVVARLRGGETGGTQRGSRMGGMSFGKILVLLAIMTASVIYVLKPLVDTYGFGWLSILVCMLLTVLLTRLFKKGE